MEQQIFIPIFIFIIGCIIFISFYFSKKAVVKRKLKKAIGKNISDFRDGDIAKVVGSIQIIGRPVISPLSGRPCAYYYVLIEQKVSNGKNSHWKNIIEEEISGCFLVKDGKYHAHINSSKVKSYIVQDRIYRSGFLNDATEALENYLNKHQINSENFLGLNKTLRYKEGVLEQDEMIAVMGQGEWKMASQLGIPDSYGKVLDIVSTEEHSIFLSDDPDTLKSKC